MSYDISKVTPRPWHISSTHVYSLTDGGGNVCSASDPNASRHVEYTHPEIGGDGLLQAAANAHHIVHCVNAHDELVESLEGLCDIIRTCDAMLDPEVKDRVKAACALLAKVKP